MKSAGFLATFTLISFVQIVKGQQNGLLNNQNMETNNLVSQQHPSHTMANLIQRYLNQNGKTSTLPNNANQRQAHVELSLQPPLPNKQELQRPPDLKQNPQLQPLQQQPLQVQQSLQLQQPLKFQQPLQQLQVQQPFGLQQNSLQQMTSFQETSDVIPPVIQQKHNCQQCNNPQIQFKLQPQAVNFAQPLNSQNVLHPQQNPILRPAEAISTPPKPCNKNQDVSTVRYHISSQQPMPLSPSNPPVVSNPSIALIPSYNIKPIDQTYIAPYSYIKPVPEVQPAVVELTTSVNPLQTSPSVLTLPSPTVQNTNTQTYYYNQATDSRPNVYVNQNQGFIYPHQSHSAVNTAQSQLTALIPSQPQIVSSVPVSIVKTPQVSPQYAISSTYPVNSIVSPTYTSQKSKSLNLKSFLPLILNLLREKIATCGCPCDCKNKSGDNEPEVLSGYSSQKHYGVQKEDIPPAFNTESEELESHEGLRKRNNCKKNEKAGEVGVREDSEESQENEESDEEVSDEEKD